MRLLYLIVTLTAGCGILEPNEERLLGIIYIDGRETSGERPLIEVPDTVAVATPFTVSAMTAVGGCKRGGDTEVLTSGDTVTITVYDYSSARHIGSNEACTGQLILYEHAAQVTFDARGAGTVVVRGATYFPTLTEIEYEFEVWVE